MKRVVAFTLFVFTAAIGGGVAQAQGANKVYRIGVVSPGAPPPGPLAAFSAGLRERGYVEGRNLRLEWRFAEGRNERLPALVDELSSAKVDVLFVVNTQAAQAAKKRAATSRSSSPGSRIRRRRASSRAFRGRAAISPEFRISPTNWAASASRH